MERQGLLEKIVYVIVGIIFFTAYYLLITEYFNRAPFSSWLLVLSIYFILAIFAFPISGQFLSEKIDVPGINSLIIMPLAYISASITSIVAMKHTN